MNRRNGDRGKADNASMDHRHAMWLVGPLLLALASRLLAGDHRLPYSSGPPPARCRRWVQVEPPGSGLVCLDSRPASRLRAAGVSRACLRALLERGHRRGPRAERRSSGRLGPGLPRPGDAVRAPRSAHCRLARMAPAKIEALGLPVDLNSASAQELRILPGVGPRLARRILRQRHENGPFGRPQDLLHVKGVGPRLLARIIPRILPLRN